MATTTSATKAMAGKFVFVTTTGGGREVFFGKTIDEPFGDQMSVEGKSIGWTPQGFLAVRPFTTVVNFPTKSPGYQIQTITDQAVLEELTTIYRTAVNQVTRTNFPLTYRWIESAFHHDAFFTNATTATPFARTSTPRTYGFNAFNPFYSFYMGFANSAEQFRRALFTSPQVTSTKEMDKITELEGDMTIEIGKITNEIAVKCNQLINRDHDLGHYFQWIQGYSVSVPPTNQIAGWLYLINRLQIAKTWARRNGKTTLVRETNTLVKEGINRLNETILEHCSSLDTLITETCSQYGIQFETFGEMSPFANYTTPYSGTFEGYGFEPQFMTGTLVGAGV
jgi:hypothetical protein